MLKKIKEQSEFSRNVMTLMTGAMIAQAIPIAISPILTRIYSPEEFGVFALYMSIVSIIAVISTGRYEVVVMLPEKDEDAINIVALSISIALFVSIITFFIVFAFNTQIAKLIGNPDISNWLYFIPASVLLTGVYQSFNYWSNRHKKYKRLAVSKVVQSGSAATTNLGMGFAGFGVSGLVIGQITGHFLSTAVLGWTSWVEDKKYLKNIKTSQMLVLARKYLSFLKYGVSALFTSAVAQQSLFFLVSIYLNAAILGFISLIQRLVSLPSAFIGKNLGDVFYQEISRVKKENSFRPIFKFFYKLTIYSFLIHILLYICLELFFVTIFGENWVDAVVYIKYMVLVAAFSFVFAPLTVLFNYYEIQHLNFIWQLLWLVSNILTFVVYSYFDLSVESLFLIYSLKQSILYIAGTAYFLHYARTV